MLASLEAVAGWRTDRVQRPVMILGRLDGIATGSRRLRRTRPLETEEIDGPRVPTLAEMARIKAGLLATRHTVHDDLECAVLFERLGDDGTRDALLHELSPWPSGASPLVEITERLAAAAPSDAPAVDLRTHKGSIPPWTDWDHVAARGRRFARVLAALVLDDGDAR